MLNDTMNSLKIEDISKGVNKKIIKDNFSRYAHLYDRYSAIQSSCAEKLIDQITSRGLKRILEVGCGTGNYTRLLRNRFSAVKIKAVDISSKMIKVARTKLNVEQIEFIVADAEKFNLKEKFDMVSSNVSFQWFENLEESLAKYKKMLVKDGIILFSTFGPRTFWELHKSLEEFCGRSLEISAGNFVDKVKIKHFLESLFRKSRIKEKIYKEQYSSLGELLKKIKYTGARGKGLTRRCFWTRNTVLGLENIYMRKFKAIVVTYQVFFCRGIR